LMAGRYTPSPHANAHQRVSTAFRREQKYLVRKQGPSAEDSPALARLQHIAPCSAGPGWPDKLQRRCRALSAFCPQPCTPQ